MVPKEMGINYVHTKECMVLLECQIVNQILKTKKEFLNKNEQTLSTFLKGLCRECSAFYNKNDDEVQKDSELQKWILDIFEHGFLSQAETGEL